MNQREDCPKCERRYTQGNPAKKLINCNHTICFQCLNQEIICPIDRKRIEKRKYTIEAFHNNAQIMKNILNLIPQTHTTQSPNTLSQQQMPNKHLSNNPKIIATSNSSHSCYNLAKSNSKCSPKSPENQDNHSIKQQKTNEISTFKTPPKTSPPGISNDPIQFQICLLHSKNADLICTQDQSFICSSCALFGEHKQHNVISYDSFVAKINKITDGCLYDYEHLKEKQSEVTEEQMKEFMQELMKERRSEIVKNVQNNFKRMRDSINKLQKEIITGLDVIINFKKQKISKIITFEDINKKVLDYYRKVENLGSITEDFFRLKSIDGALKFIDDKSQQSYLCKEGEYLMLEIDSCQQLIKKNIQKEALDFQYQWNSSMQQAFIEGIIAFQSNDLSSISQLLQQRKQKSKPLTFMSKAPPKAVTPTVQKNKEEQILLINTDSKSNSQGSAQQNQKKKNISPIQPVQRFQYPAEIKYASSCRNLNKQNEDHPFIKMSDMPLSNSTSIHQNSNSMHRKTSSSFNRTITIAPSIKKRMIEEQDKKHQLSVSRYQQNKSKSKSNNNSSHTTERQLLNVLNEKSENKRRKKIDIPEKFTKVWEDLQRDKLDIVDFGGAFLGDTNMMIVSEFFQKSNKLKSIKLMNNHISDQVFPQLIQRCLKAHSLNLSYNNLTQKCLDFLERQAQYLGDLRNITLSKNKIVLRNVKDRLDDLKKRGINVSL